jgi:hypothetical protein
MMAKRPTTESRLADARGAASAATARIKELEAKRSTALLHDDDAGAATILADIERLRVFVRNAEDKAGLLAEELQKETALRHAKENEALIGRIESKLAAREATAAELVTVIGKANELMLEMFEQSRAIDAAWGWAGGDRHALLLPREEMVGALQIELYRQTANPLMGGGQREHINAGWKFPGARPARLDLTHLPGKNPSLLEAVRSASSFASDIMRGRRTPATPAPVVPVTAPPARQRSLAEVELAGLLQKQSELAAIASPSVDDDRAYADVVQKISIAQATLEKEQQNV